MKGRAVMRICYWLIQTIGAVSIVLSVWGFYLVVDGFRGELARPVVISKAPFFRQAFFVMNAIDATILIAIILTAIGLLTLRPNAVRVYTWLYVALAIYAFAPGALWIIPGPVGTSIAAASGVGEVGLGPLLFFPVPFAYAILSVVLVNVAAPKLRAPSGFDASRTSPVKP
jgi:hypothetical protein